MAVAARIFNSVFRKYAAAFCAAVVALVGALVTMDHIVGSKEARQQAETLQIAEMRTASSWLRAEFSQIERSQEQTLTLPWMASGAESAEQLTELQRFMKLNRTVSAVSLYHPEKGETRSSRRSTNVAANGNIDGFPRQPNDRSDLVYYGPVAYDEDSKYAQLVVRLKAASSNVMHSMIDLRFVDQEIRKLGFGRTGVVYIVDSTFRVLAHSDTRFSLRPTDVAALWSRRGWADAQNASERLPFVDTVSFTERRVMAVAMKMEPLGWWLVAEQEVEEAMMPVTQQLFRNLAMLGGGVVLSLIAAYFFARKLSAPIKNLHSAAQSIAHGKLTERVTFESNDELGALGNAFNSMASELQSLTSGLEEKIGQKTAQLKTEFEHRETQSKEIAKLEERARIMRDFHDGVGGHLVGLLGAAKRDALDAKQIEAMVGDALIDFRLAIDSLTPEETDLITALAGLRFRLTPRLEAAGLASSWSLEELPTDVSYSRETVFNIQRIVMEALTNVLKHAHAKHVAVRVTANDVMQVVLVEVIDDGIGFEFFPNIPANQSFGRGVSNILQRARAIGANVRWHYSLHGVSGTQVQLEVPFSWRTNADRKNI